MAQSTSERTAARIRGLLGERRLSGRQLADRMGRPATTLARRLAGAYPWDLDELDAVAAALEVPVADLITPRER